MSPVTAFCTGLVATMGVVFLALLYLRSPLQAILTDLCGTVERARFWTTFSNITLFLVPFALALNQQPAAEATKSLVFEISDQIESAVIGLVISVMILGMVLSRYILRSRFVPSSNDIDTNASGSQTGAAVI
jgi:hypothetical protein